ncbi:MAG TPA: MFS transporter [Acetobacteraceae bacterium]|nr:MFS transporter [Acetobacteraceae bacterium]
MIRGAAARLIAIARCRDSRLLVVVRGVRSIGQGALVVDFALYLRDLHWTGGQIGALLTAAMVSGIALMMLVGPLSDRIGRKSLLLGFEITRVLAALIALSSSDPWLLAVAALLGQYGRGGNGAAGPFGPVERAWLAHSVPPEARVSLYSVNSAVGFLGRAVGALLAAVPALLSGWLLGPFAYRPLFALVLVTSAISTWLISRIAEERRPARPAAEPSEPSEVGVGRRENALLRRLVLANLLQGAGLGLSGPLTTYWFAVKFGQGPALIGPLMAASLVLAALASVAAGRLARRHGIVPVVIGMRLVGIGLLAAMPLAPSLPFAAGLFAARSLFNRGTNGPRRALSMGLVRAQRRGLAGSINSVSLAVPRAVGPLFAGLLFDTGFLALPFLLAAGFQAGYLCVYGWSFADHDRKMLGAARAGAAE